MEFSRRLCLFVVMSLAVVCNAGDVQVSCEPELRVYLDDEFMGTSSAREDGLFLMDVKAGSHVIRVEKDGFVPQNFDVDTVTSSIEVVVEEFTPLPPAPAASETVPAEAPKGVGVLVITSAPQYCFVEIDGEVHEKTSPTLTIGGLAAGEHSISFSKEGWQSISGVVTVEPGADVTIRGNFKAGEVETTHQGKGSLRVVSKPQRCSIQFMGKTIDKHHMKHNISYIPAGEYPIRFVIPGRELSSTILIKSKHRTIVEVSFMPGEKPLTVTYVPL